MAALKVLSLDRHRGDNGDVAGSKCVKVIRRKESGVSLREARNTTKETSCFVYLFVIL